MQLSTQLSTQFTDSTKEELDHLFLIPPHVSGFLILSLKVLSRTPAIIALVVLFLSIVVLMAITLIQTHQKEVLFQDQRVGVKGLTLEKEEMGSGINDSQARVRRGRFLPFLTFSWSQGKVGVAGRKDWTC